MSRLLQLLIVLLLLAATTLVSDDISSAQPVTTCPHEGRWKISYVIVFEYGISGLEGPGARWEEYGTIFFNVNCDGSIYSEGYTGGGNITVVNIFDTGCSGDYEDVPITGSVTDSGGFPVFNIVFSPFSYINGDCNDGESAPRDLVMHTNQKIDEGTYEGDLITSVVLADAIPDEDVTIEIYIVEAERRYRPEIVQVNPQYTKYFLHGIAVDDKYSFVMNWDGAPKPSADLSIQGGEWQPMEIDGDNATYTVKITDLPFTEADFASSKVIPVTMEMTYPFITFHRSFAVNPDQVRMAVVEVPSWAKKKPFTATPEGDHIVYRTTRMFPEKAIETPQVDIPKIVPVIGGKWGLEPVQMTVNIGVNSLGSTHSEKITGTGKLNLGGKAYALEYGGDFWTEIDLQSGVQPKVNNNPNHFTIKLKEPVIISESIPILSFVPFFNQLLNAPVIGDLLKSAAALVSLKFQLTAAVDGMGYFDVLPTDELGITEGSLNLSIDGTIAGSANIGVAWLVVAGTIGADVEISLAPEVTLSTCNMPVGITVVVGAVELGTTQFPLFTSIPLCDL
jgi:hypothetical protein